VELREQDVSIKMLARILPLLDKLHDCGTERDSAGNRTTMPSWSWSTCSTR
jgi:hypothetical protein